MTGNERRHRGTSVHRVLALVSVMLAGLSSFLPDARALPAAQTAPSDPAADYVILFVLEGVDRRSLKTGPMPVLSRLAAEGAATWSARTVTPPLRLPAMASLLTGLPVDKHGITWESFEFSRGYPRPPTLFDYLDLSGGRDSAIFFMDESLYQLAKPEPYTDYQMCGPLRPECSPDRLVSYIKHYFSKAVSGHGYGHAVPALPHLLLVHLPEGQRAGEAHGWTSREYRHTLSSVDAAMGSILDMYTRHGLLNRTTVFATSLQSRPGIRATSADQAEVPWIVSGKGIKPAHLIRQPVSIIDTGATIMRTLGLTTHVEWDSRIIEEVFREQAITTAAPGNER